mgnify:CR=1 FL=1
MSRRTTFEARFVEFVPEVLEEGVLYVSVEYTTVVHKCYCGCGNQVVTPLAPVFWELTFDGEAVSLFPSVGNWSFPCRSHYWIVRNRVVESWSWTDEEIDHARRLDARARRDYLARRWEREVMPSTGGSDEQGSE